MPLYEYACKDCNTRFEKLVKSMSSTEKVACPKCGSPKTERALSVFAVRAAPAAAGSAPTCGHCGGAPGSCRMGS